jgi:hypothetical protein
MLAATLPPFVSVIGWFVSKTEPGANVPNERVVGDSDMLHVIALVGGVKE